MGLTWIAIASSLLMGGGGLLIFIWSVRAHMFKDFEDRGKQFKAMVLAL